MSERETRRAPTVEPSRPAAARAAEPPGRGVLGRAGRGTARRLYDGLESEQAPESFNTLQGRLAAFRDVRLRISNMVTEDSNDILINAVFQQLQARGNAILEYLETNEAQIEADVALTRLANGILDELEQTYADGGVGDNRNNNPQASPGPQAGQRTERREGEHADLHATGGDLSTPVHRHYHAPGHEAHEVGEALERGERGADRARTALRRDSVRELLRRMNLHRFVDRALRHGGELAGRAAAVANGVSSIQRLAAGDSTVWDVLGFGAQVVGAIATATGAAPVARGAGYVEQGAGFMGNRSRRHRDTAQATSALVELGATDRAARALSGADPAALRTLQQAGLSNEALFQFANCAPELLARNNEALHAAIEMARGWTAPFDQEQSAALVEANRSGRLALGNGAVQRMQQVPTTAANAR